MFSSLIVDGLEEEYQLPSCSNQMVSGLVHCRDAAADSSGAGWKVQTTPTFTAVVTARSNHSIQMSSMLSRMSWRSSVTL